MMRQTCHKVIPCHSNMKPHLSFCRLARTTGARRLSSWPLSSAKAVKLLASWTTMRTIKAVTIRNRPGCCCCMFNKSGTCSKRTPTTFHFVPLTLCCNMHRTELALAAPHVDNCIPTTVRTLRVIFGRCRSGLYATHCATTKGGWMNGNRDSYCWQGWWDSKMWSTEDKQYIYVVFNIDFQKESAE